MKSFKQFLNEGKGQLDISIMPAAKYLTSQKRIEEFLYTPVLIEEKTDGVKVTAIKVANRGTLDDWILAYKGNILYDGEFDFGADSSIKGSSIGASQFKFVIDHFKEVVKNGKSIPVGTELFIEYLMRKMTLSSDYTRKHGMVLIGHSKSKHKEKNGKLITKPSGFDISKRDEYASTMDLDVPAVLFKGILGDKGSFEKGIIHKGLKDMFKVEAPAMNWDNNELLVDDIRHLLLKIDSYYGNESEGVVVKFANVVLKFQKEYQLDKEARREIKLKYQSEDPKVETQYWNDIRRLALEIVNDIPMKPTDKLKDLVKEISFRVKTMKIDIKHPKRVKVNMQDDIQLTSKQIIMRKLKGNNNALTLGKFRVLTKAHYGMIQEGLDKFDGVTVALITSKDTKHTKDLRRKMLETAFGNKIEIVESTSGNLLTLMNKTDENINWVMAGTDRVQAYETQLARNPDVRVYEIERTGLDTDDDVSASKVIANINDDKYFKENTPKEIHSMYEEIKMTYQGA
jgi:phosphopantetheine adenylyltransferase